MPELPEVETVRRILERDLLGLTISGVEVFYPRLIQTDLSDFKENIVNKKILSLGRKGKYLIIHLSDNYALLVHFRMEGKLFYVDSLEENLNKYVTLYFCLNNSHYLIFNDVRKFGVMVLYKENELPSCKELVNLGKEPWDIDSPSYLLNAYKNKNYLIKEGLLDQSVILGLGNIYADETLYRSKISPFKKAKDISKDEAKKIIENASLIMKLAIENNGSTIRSYHPSKETSGNMQSFLLAYGKKGQECPNCHTIMEKKFVGGRGTTYCPKCQNVKPSIAITGKIAVGKSQVTSAFKKLDCYVASADQLVHDLYVNAKFIKELQKKFPEVFNQGKLDKSLVIKSMTESKSFRRKYETFIWSKIKDLVNDFLIHHTDKVAVVEVPLLFDAKMEDQFTYLVGVESSNQVKHLISRNDLDYERRLKMNERNSYDLHRKELDFIIDNEGSLLELEEKVKRIYMNVLF